MKKLFFLALLALCMPMSTWADYAVGDEGTDDEQEDYDNGKIESASVPLVYRILTVATEDTPGTVELEGVSSTYSGNTGVLSIPHEIHNLTYSDGVIDVQTYTVVGIAMGAFGAYSSANADNTITSVTIPYTVTYLGTDEGSSMSGGCFTYCTNLTSVIFAESSNYTSQLELIGSNAFLRCTALESIDIPSTVTTIASNAFAYCSSLTEVKIPSGVTSLGSNEFQNCTSLKTVYMPGSLELTARVFDSCTSLSAIVLEGEPGTNGGNEGNNAFANDNGETITLYVPIGLAEVYLASAWETDVEGDTTENLVWNFITTPVSISSSAVAEDGAYYGTYYVPEDGYFLYGATAYTVESVTANNEYGGSVNLSELTADLNIPACTALLVEATEAGDYYLYKEYGVTRETLEVGTNLLYGSSVAVDTSVDGETEGYYFYMLSLDEESTEGSVGFYWGADDGAAFTSAAYKAYLAVEQSIFASDDGDATPTRLYIKKPTLDEQPTGITAVETSAKAAVEGIYTLQGVRVNNMNQKGIYIVNGKKVIVK